MKNKQIVVVDVGTSNVVIAVGAVEDDDRVNIVDIVAEPVTGVNAGRIENSDMVGLAIASAKKKIEQRLNIRLTEVYAGLSGEYVRCVQVTDHVYVKDELRNGSNQITQSDIDELDRRMKTVKLPDDRETIMTMQPLRYKVDEKEVDVPVGAYGHLLTATYNFILCDKAMRDRLSQCLQVHGISVKEFVPNAFVSHLSIANTDDMQDGAVVVDLGGGVTDVTVLYGGKVRYMASIPIGANAINNDIRTYSIPSNYVEDLKVQYGSAMVERAVDDIIVFQSMRRGMPKSILRRNLVTVIESRLKEIAGWVAREIKDAGCGSKFMPVVLLTGGGSNMRDIEALFARELGYEDVRAVHPEYGFVEESLLEHITTPAYATAASLLIYGATHGECAVSESPVRRHQPSNVVVNTPDPAPVHVRPRSIRDDAPQSVDNNTEQTPVEQTEQEPQKFDDEDVSFNPEGGDDKASKTSRLTSRLSKMWNKLNNAFVQNENDSEF